MELCTESSYWENPSDEQIALVIRDLPEHDYAILASGSEVFMQTMLLEPGYLLEKRDGGDDSHYEAIPKDDRKRVTISRPWWAFWEKSSSIYYFSDAEIIQAFCAYKRGTEPPCVDRWSQIWI